MTEIYGVTGMPLSGKTTVAKILQDEGFELVDMGDVVRREMKKRDIKAGNEGSFVNGQREEKGMDAIAQLTVPYVREAMENSEKIVITGMRGWSEKQRFEEELDGVMDIIAVWASRQRRKLRRSDRQREEDVKGQGFHERDIREIENGVGKLMALSDHLIDNDDLDMEELETEVRNLCNQKN